MGQIDAHQPRWLRDLERFLPLKSQFVLSGNIRDFHATCFHGAIVPNPLSMVLDNSLRRIGYEAVIGYDRIAGFHTITPQSEFREALEKRYCQWQHAGCQTGQEFRGECTRIHGVPVYQVEEASQERFVFNA